MKTCIYLVAWLFCIVTTTPLSAQQSSYQLDYLQNHKDYAIREMLRSGIPASIILAHALLESGAGQNELATAANNHFGTICGKTWTGLTHSKLRYNKEGILESACFRVYPDAAASFRDFTRQFTAPDRIGAYRMLFKLPTTDYLAWANGLELSGFVSSRVYAEKMVKTIEDYGLYRYDAIFYMKGRLPERYWSEDDAQHASNRQLAATSVEPASPSSPYGFQATPEKENAYGHELARSANPERSQLQARMRIKDYGGQLVASAGSEGQRQRSYYTVVYNGRYKPDAGFDKDQFAVKKSNVVLANYSVASNTIYPSLPNTSLVSKVYHRVNSGETLRSLARQYRTTVEYIIHWNGLNGEQIQPGKVLRVS